MDRNLDLAPCGYIAFGDDGTITAANSTLREMLSFSGPAPEGLNIESILSLASRIFYQTHFFPMMRLHGKAEEIFFSLRTTRGVDVPVIVNGVRRHEEGVHTNHCVLIPVLQRQKYEDEILQAKKAAEDVSRQNTELRHLTEELEKKTRELDFQYNRLVNVNKNLLEFNKIISHDMQEPIHKIQVFTNMMLTEQSANLNERSRKAVSRIDAAARRLRQLIAGLEEFVRIDSEKSWETVDLNVALERGRLRAVEESGFDQFDLSLEKMPEIDGHAAQLALLFYHLIDNSIKFRDPVRSLEIMIGAVLVRENSYRALQEKYLYTDHVKISYIDNGVGFDNRYSQQVFDMVAKLGAETSGVGLGLSLCKKIVDNHSGTIRAFSEPGKGSKFDIVLPLRRSFV